jgi:hypothetical protein
LGDVSRQKIPETDHPNLPKIGFWCWVIFLLAKALQRQVISHIPKQIQMGFFHFIFIFLMRIETRSLQRPRNMATSSSFLLAPGLERLWPVCVQGMRRC